MADQALRITVGIPTYNRAALLQETIESALAQSYGDLRVLICDNASDDGTEDVVRSFADRRIAYSHSEVNIGMIANFNRVFALAEADAVVLLADDDILYPEFLASVAPVLAAHPNLGVVHTNLDLIDADSKVLVSDVDLVGAHELVNIEAGATYLERSMHSLWTVGLSAALFRTEAVRRTGGFRPHEHPSADVPFLMRIALDWDFALVAQPLAGIRVHANAATAGIAGWTGAGYDLGSYAENLLERRMQFLVEAPLPEARRKAYRTIARREYRRASVERLAATTSGEPGWASLFRLASRQPAILRLPETWSLVARRLGGRRVKRLLSHAASLRKPS